MFGAIFQIDLLGDFVAQHIRNVREVLQTPLLWVGSPKLEEAEAKSQSGGYHTVFRGVKQVTAKINGKFVNFSTGLPTASIDATDPMRVVLPRPLYD